jgi:hypothetical protein
MRRQRKPGNLYGMTDSRFADRLDGATYQDDEPVGVFSDDPERGVWVSERLWDRIRLLGQAYGLHTLPLLVGEASGGDGVTLNALQVETLRDELVFVEARANDDLVTHHARAVSDYLAMQLRSPSGEVSVTVE